MTPRAPALLSLCVLAGCAAPLPRYPGVSTQEALDILAGRAESLRTLSAECEITLTDPAGESVRLDGATALAFPDRVRIRAWKFGQVAFDITAAEGRVWVLTADAPGPRHSADKGVLAAVDRLPVAIGLLGPEYFRAATPRAGDDRDDRLTVTGPAPGGEAATCVIDRSTITVRELFFTGPESPPTRRVRFDRYRTISGMPWPTLLEFSGPEGVIVLRLRDVSLNEPLAESAFVPPRRAVEQP